MTNADPHRVEIVPNEHRLRVIHYGITIADTTRGFTLRETGLPDVLYFPREDVNMSRLRPSDYKTFCPHKGTAMHFHLVTEEAGMVENVAWSYEDPLETAARIKGCIAFYPARVERIHQTS